jgi:hypothetical protein
MVFFKACLRCKGDMHMNRDIYGEYGKCLQCGFMVDIGKNRFRVSKLYAQSKKRKEKKRSLVVY